MLESADKRLIILLCNNNTNYLYAYDGFEI